MIITHMKFPIRLELDDPFDSLDNLILKDFTLNGWSKWVGIGQHNDNQLELFDTTKYQKWDRFGKPYKKPKSVYVEKTV